MADLADLSFRVDSRALRGATRDLDRFGREGTRTARATDRITSGFGRASAAARGLGGAMAAIGAGLSIGSVIQTLAGFEKSMAKVKAISGATDDQFQALRETAKSLGSTTEFTASQAADAMGFLSMAGFSAAETLTAIPTVLDLATASGMDLARTADIASNVLSGFQLEVAETARVADVLAKSASISNTSVEQMGNAMSYAAPVAAALGISIEEAAAAVGVLSDAGIQGERAGTSLRTALSQLGAPSKDAHAALARLGLTADDVNPALNSMGDIFATLRDAGVDLAAATDLVGIEAASSLLVLTSGADKYDEYADKLRNAEGASKDMAATMRDQLGGAMAGFGSAVEGLVIALGDAGLTDILRTVIDTGTEFLRMLSGMESLGEVAATAGIAAAALGALIFPFAAVGVAAAAAAVWISTNWEELGDRFPRIFAAIDRAGEILSGVFDGLRDVLGAAAGWVREKAVAVAEAMGPAVELMKEQFGLFGDAIGAAWQGDWSAAWEAVRTLAENGVEGLLSAFDAVRNFEMPEIDLSGMIPEEIAGLPAVEKLTTALSAARDVLVDLADKADSAVSTIFDGALASFSERMEPISAAAERFSDALGPLGDALSGLGSALADLLSGSEGSDETADRLTSIGSAIGKIAAVLTEGLLSLLTGMAKSVTALVEGVTAALEGDWEAAWDLAASAPQALLDEMAGLWASIKPVLEDLWRDVKAAVAGWPADMLEVGGNIVDGLVQGIKGKIQDAKDAIASLGQLLPAWMRREVDSHSPSRVFMGIGHDITDGLAIGITQRGKAAEAAAVGVADGVLKGAKRALDIRSPSRKFHGVGTMSIDGMIDGIEDRTGALVAQIEDTARQSIDSASSTFESGVRGMVDYMVRGFEDGLGGLADMFKRTLMDMAATAATNKIMIGLGFGGSGAGAMGGALGSALGGIGSTVGGMLTTFSQNAIGIFGADMAGLSATLAGATGSLTGFAAAAGALALPIAGAVAAFDFFRTKTKVLDEGIRLTADGVALAVDRFAEIRKSRFWGLKKSRSTDYTAAPDDIANPLTKAVGQMQTSIMQAADALGVGKRAFRDFAYQIKLSTEDMTEEEAVRVIQEEMAGLSDAFARMVPGAVKLRQEGERTTDALIRTATTLATVNGAFNSLGFDMLDKSLRGGKVANRLVEMSGGLQQFAQATQYYFDNIMSAPDRLKALTKQFNQALNAANINARPGGVGQFQNRVEKLMDAGKVQKAQSLINLAPLFTEIQRLQGELDTTGDTAGRASDRIAKANDRIRDEARKAEAVERERVGLQQEVWRLLGRENKIRKATLAALDPSNRALQRRIFAIEREQEAAERAADKAERRAQRIEARQEERAGLQTQVWQLLGRENKLRAQALADLKPANRALQERIWKIEDEQAATEKANAVADERRGIREQIWQALGKEDKIRKSILRDLDPANRALQERLFRIQDEQAATERANAVTQERRGLQDQLWQLNGREDLIRKRALRSLDESNRALQARIWRLEDEAEAAQKAAAASSERAGLLQEFWQLRGGEHDAYNLRQLELRGIDESNRALFEKIQLLRREKTAEEAAAQVASERLGLQSQLWQALGDENALRAQALKSLDPSNRAIQERIWRLEDEATAAERASAVSSERAGLLREFWQLRDGEHDAYNLRQMELRGIDGSNRALMEKIQLLRRERSAEEAAQRVADERLGIQRQIWDLTGNTTAIERDLLASLDPANRALQEQVFALEKQATAAEKAAQAEEDRRTKMAAIADERLGLQRQIWEAEGNTAAIRRDILAQLDPTNRALQSHLWALEEQAEATERASAIADERTGLESRLLELQGNTAELRRRELAGLDASNRSLQLMIWGLEDAAKAMEDLDPAAFATRLDYERARARAVSGVGGVTSSGMPLAVVPSAGPQSVQASNEATAKEIRDLVKQVKELTVKVEQNTYKSATIAARQERKAAR